MRIAMLIIGWLGFATSLSYRIPQLFKIYKRKSAIDISLNTIFVQNLSYVLYTIYGFMLPDPIWYTSSIIAFLQNMVIVGLYWKYHGFTQKEENTELVEVAVDSSKN